LRRFIFLGLRNLSLDPAYHTGTYAVKLPERAVHHVFGQAPRVLTHISKDVLGSTASGAIDTWYLHCQIPCVRQDVRIDLGVIIYAPGATFAVVSEMEPFAGLLVHVLVSLARGNGMSLDVTVEV
jgi:hypothetical protein